MTALLQQGIGDDLQEMAHLVETGRTHPGTGCEDSSETILTPRAAITRRRIAWSRCLPSQIDKEDRPGQQKADDVLADDLEGRQALPLDETGRKTIRRIPGPAKASLPGCRPPAVQGADPSGQK